MKRLVTILLVGIGLLNFLPLIGVVSTDQLTRLYGIAFEQPDLAVLMRHRAVLFGLIGGFILLAAFRPSLQLIATIAGLVSMLCFILLAWATEGVGDELGRIVIADIAGSVAAVIVLVVLFFDKRQRDSR